MTTEYLQKMTIERAKKKVHATYFKIRNRMTGLYNMGPKEATDKWDFKGHLFRNKRALHSFMRNWLTGHGEFPREWEIVPVELMIREEKAENARVHWDVLRSGILFDDYEDGEKPAEKNKEHQFRLKGIF
jgi:hypothetical protein